MLTTTAKSSLGFGAGFADVQRSAVKVRAIQAGDRAIRIRVGAHFDKSKPLGPTAPMLELTAFPLQPT